MSRIDEIFSRLRAAGRKAFVPYITCGDPNLARSEELIVALEEAGAHCLELGVPFSDPMADGPTIQAASQRALASGATLAQILEMIARVRPKVELGLSLFTYFNPVLRYGLEKFCEDARSAGADAILIPDLTPEEAPPLLAPARKHDLDTVFLIAPTSTEARIRLVGEVSRGFVYAVSLTGVTGARDRLPDELSAFLTRARKVLGEKPLVVGFGISTREQARQVAALCDGAVVGSAIVKVIEKAGDSADLVPQVKAFAQELAAGVAEAGQ